jgi:N-methylhydantoinase A
MIDIITIGTGGGSIAWVDPSGSLRVGPKSAGAAPGPMCYGRGGDEPTLTDANLLLGRLPTHLLGGEVPLDTERARFGLERLGEQVGLSAEALAAGVLEIADWNQVNAIRQVTVRKGLDPRAYAMVAFGGSGPLQAGRVAQLLGLQHTIIPPNPGNISAYGLLAVDLKMDYVATAVQREDRFDPSALQRVYERLEADARRDLTAEGISAERQRLERSMDIRYFGEAYEIRIDMPSGSVWATTLSDAVDTFHAAHDALYGYSYRATQLTEIVNLRVTAFGLIDKPDLTERPFEGEQLEPADFRQIHFDSEYRETPIYDRIQLSPGARIAGPAVVEEYGSTTVLQPDQDAHVDQFANLVIRPSGGRGA